MNAITLRTATSADYDALGTVMFAAIHDGPTQYTKAQSEAWAPEPRQGQAWAERLSGKHILVAQREDGILGFMSIEPGGYIDFAYIHPKAQGSGLFRRLFEGVCEIVASWGETQLSTHASLMAQPAFAAMGFRVDRHETVHVSGQDLDRAQMSKPL